jgi:phosphoglycerate dehydrogenase-like enzyme
MKIMLTIDLNEKYLNRIRETVPGAEVVKAVDVETQKRELQDTEIVVAFGDSLKLELLPEAENLNWIQSWAAGVDNYTTPEVMKHLIDNNVKLTTMSGIHGDIIAEHTMGLVISFSRKLHKFYEQQKKGIWQRLKVDQLEGKTMAIIGLGAIGKEIAHKAKAFKMHTIGVKKNINEKIDCVDELYSNDELLSVLNKADYVVVIVPLTDETTRMFGKEEFRAMKETAYFINMARGQVVNEEELILALEEGWIAGAGLDVFEEEPLPSDSPLYRLDNVLITPHVGGIHPDYHKKAVQVFLNNLERYQKGLELNNLVDYNRGY